MEIDFIKAHLFGDLLSDLFQFFVIDTYLCHKEYTGVDFIDCIQGLEDIFLP